ncbi:phage integrase family protein [Paraburkholderia sp. GV068]|uniref:phage integrase family protein n=1 Tax=Paraburkholderia TaxID=1822464 RepID=UPI0035C10EFA
MPQPQVSDAVDVWLPARVAPVLHQHGIQTLTDLTLRIPRRRRWWRTISGLGVRSAGHIKPSLPPTRRSPNAPAR